MSHTHTHTLSHTNTHSHTISYTCTHILMHTHTHTLSILYTHTHTHTHIQERHASSRTHRGDDLIIPHHPKAPMPATASAIFVCDSPSGAEQASRGHPHRVGRAACIQPCTSMLVCAVYTPVQLVCAVYTSIQLVCAVYASTRLVCVVYRPPRTLSCQSLQPSFSHPHCSIQPAQTPIKDSLHHTTHF